MELQACHNGSFSNEFDSPTRVPLEPVKLSRLYPDFPTYAARSVREIFESRAGSGSAAPVR
jgi:hypothetical protein